MRNMSMKFSEVVKIEKPKYKYLKLIPNNSVRNQSTYKISRTIASLYKNLFQRVKADEKKLITLFGKDYLIGSKYTIQLFEKVGYFIYIEKDKIEFYFIIPEKYESIIVEKINNVWSGITITEIEELPEFKKTATTYALTYSKEDALSLSIDLRNNDLLRSNLNIVNVLEENDKIGLFYNFTPTTQYTWRNEYKHTIEKLNNNQPVDREKGKITYLLKYALAIITDLSNIVLSSFSTKESNQENFIETMVNKMNGPKEISPSTIRKESSTILNTQIVLISQADEKVRQQNNARSIIQSFDSIADDNRLIPKQIKYEFKYDDFKIKNAPINKVSDLESQSMLSLAGRDILEEYDFIDKVETRETRVPEDLQNGIFRIGTNTYRGNKQEAYLSTDKEYRNLTQMLIGPTRAGKSTLIANMVYDAIMNDECIFLFDFIKKCELSKEVIENIPKDKVLRVRCDDFDNLQGLGYNEVGFANDVFKQYDNAKKQATQLRTLVNSINNEESSLSAKMERYLESASLVAFINNGSIKDVFDVLQNHNKRNSLINKVPSNQLENMQEYIDTLRTLDEYDKDDNIIGSKLNLVAGIIDRLGKLKQNTYMELMLKRDTSNNIDLAREIQKNQLITLEMPENMFNTSAEKDAYTTYWITKLFLALQIRGEKIERENHTKVNLIIDEIYQVGNTEKFLTSKLSQLAKFTIKPIISCHYIDQLNYMRKELRSANASYMLISGCDKQNYNEFKDELHPYELEDLLKLERYHSLNLIKHKDGYAKFITKLPGPLGKRKGSKRENKNYNCGTENVSRYNWRKTKL